MFSRLKKYFKEKNNIIHERAVPKAQILKQIHRYIKKVGNFGTATLILIDIDAFHNLVELHGENLYLDMMKETAKRVVDLLPENASISQIREDGILIFIPNEGTQSKIEKLCKRLLESTHIPFENANIKDIHITTSIGVCTYPQSGSSVKSLIDNLDLASFVSKRSGGDKVTSYYATLSDDERDNKMYYEEIRTAIQRKEFVLYYHPILDLVNHTIYGAEALMRWNHPTKGILPPQDFIQLMEQTGDIHWVGEWGIDQMIRFQQEMQHLYPKLNLVISLNLSLKQILNQNLARRLIDIAKELSVRPERIMLEITDCMVYDKMKVVEANLTRLKAFGFLIAVDSFPLDQQSILAVQNAPIDVIKLGRSFLKDITNNFSQEKLLELLIDYCKKNKKRLVCEGIETKELLQYVLDQKVTLGSGFYFTRPLDAEALKKYIEGSSWQNQLDCKLDV